MDLSLNLLNRIDQIAIKTVFFHILTKNLSVDFIDLEKTWVYDYQKINYYNFQHVCSFNFFNIHIQNPKKSTLFKRRSIEIDGPLVSTMRNAFMAWFC